METTLNSLADFLAQQSLQLCIVFVLVMAATPVASRRQCPLAVFVVARRDCQVPDATHRQSAAAHLEFESYRCSSMHLLKS